ncbi:MAG: hypothetical protein WCK89_06220 [bacterium]
MKRICVLTLGQLKVLRLAISLLVWAHLSLVGVHAGDLGFSDPAKVPSVPAWAVGQANRAPDLNVLPGFQKPPPGFGTVPFYWWLGDPLTKERIGWQLEQMAGMAVSGIQINYAHSDQGGRSAEVRVNGQPAGIRVSPPWRFDITSLVKPGENRIEILVRNTLANHYTTVPTQYRGKTTAGLLGPVTLNLQKDK